MHIAKRILAVCLSLLLLMMTAASADTSFLVHSDGWAWDVPLEVLLKADVDAHMPFDDDRLAMLTTITDTLSLRLVSGQDEGSVTIAIDGEDALTLQYSGNEAQLSSMPGTTYQADADPLNALLGAEISDINVYESLGLAPEGESLLIDGRALLAAIPTAFEAYGRRSANTSNIVGIGQAAYRYDYAVEADQVEAMKTTLLSICPEGWLREIIGSLTFSGKQTLRVYYSAEDAIMRAEYNGDCGMADDLRTVKLVYKFRHDDVKDKDIVELTSPAKSGGNRNTLTFERTLETSKKGQRVLTGEFSYTAVRSGVTNVWKGSVSLVNACTDAADVISGELSLRNKLNNAEKYDILTLKPNLSISGTADAPVLTGTVEVSERYSGKDRESAVISIELKRAEPLVWQESQNIIALSQLGAEALTSVQQEVAASVATALVRPLILKLGADAEWFFRELPEDAVQSIINAAGAAN